MISSFILQKQDKECVAAKNWKQAKSPMCTKSRTHLEISWSKISQHTVTLVVSKVWTLQAYVTSSSYTGTVLRPSWHNEACFTILSTSDSWKKPCSLLVKLLSFSLVTHCSYPTVKPPPTQLFCGYFTHTFTPDTSYNSTRLVCYLYRIARKFGGGFNLAVWRIVSTSPILNSRQI